MKPGVFASSGWLKGIAMKQWLKTGENSPMQSKKSDRPCTSQVSVRNCVQHCSTVLMGFSLVKCLAPTVTGVPCKLCDLVFDFIDLRWWGCSWRWQPQAGWSVWGVVGGRAGDCCLWCQHSKAGGSFQHFFFPADCWKVLCEPLGWNFTGWSAR